MGVLKTFKNKNEFSFGIDRSIFSTDENSENSTNITNNLNETPTFYEYFISRDVLVNSTALKIDYNLLSKKIKWEFGGRFTVNDDLDNYSLNSLLGKSEIVVLGDNIFEINEKILALYINGKGGYKTSKYQFGLRNENTIVNFLDSTSKNITLNFYNLFPNFTYQYNINSLDQLQISFSRRVKRPNFEEYNFYSRIRLPLSSKEGNQNINPQFSNVFEINYNRKSSTNSLSFNLVNNVRDVIVESEGLLQVSKVVNLKNSLNFNYLFTKTLNLNKNLTSRFSISSFYETAPLIDGSKVKTLSGDISTNQLYNLKKDRFEFRLSYAAPYTSGYNTLSGYLNTYFSWNRDVFKSSSFTFSTSDILGTARLKFTNTYNNQIIELNPLNNNRNIRFSFRYNFKSGNQFNSKRRPNIQNDEIRMK